ncbi:MAG: hypothetical protein ACPL7B_02070 [Candidatus Poribacteria bacterium]
MLFFRRKPKKIPEPDLTENEMQEILEENIKFAKIYANDGNVSGMEMALEEALKYSKKLGKPLDSSEITKIKIKGYKNGAKVMQDKAEELSKAGKIRESQNANELASRYANEAELLRRLIP